MKQFLLAPEGQKKAQQLQQQPALLTTTSSALPPPYSNEEADWELLDPTDHYSGADISSRTQRGRALTQFSSLFISERQSSGERKRSSTASASSTSKGTSSKSTAQDKTAKKKNRTSSPSAARTADQMTS